MTDNPNAAPQGAAEPQPAPEVAPVAAGTEPQTPPKPQTNSDFYFQRQAEKAAKEAETERQAKAALEAKVKELEAANLTEQERKDKAAEEARTSAESMRKENARLKAIMEAQLPPELAELVPEGLDDPKTFIETKVLPLKEKLTKPTTFGAANRPDGSAPADPDQHIIDKFKQMQQGGHSTAEIQDFYNANYVVLSKALSRPLT